MEKQVLIPTLSIALPFYNEEEGAADVVAELEKVLEKSGIDYELVLVENGSKDGTGGILKAFSEKNPRIRVHKVPVNQGYGWGIIQGLGAARGQNIGFMCADGQIRPDDLIRVFGEFEKQDADVAKVMRVSRHDGLKRKSISFFYNHLFSLVFGTRCPDINGTPKIFKREFLDVLSLQSKDWFIDAELIIKASQKGLTIRQVPVDFLKREKGRSNVRWKTIVEFLKNIVRYRFMRRF